MAVLSLVVADEVVAARVEQRRVRLNTGSPYHSGSGNATGGRTSPSNASAPASGLSVLARQCLSERMSDKAQLRGQVASSPWRQACGSPIESHTRGLKSPRA